MADPPGNHKVVCVQLFPSEVSRRFDEVTVHIEIRGTWPMATGNIQLISSTKSFFGISYKLGSCQCPKTWLYRKTNVYQPLSRHQRIKIHHSCSCKLSVVHTRWCRNSLTIDMFIFTDVTASHMYILLLYRKNCIQSILHETNALASTSAGTLKMREWKMQER